MKPWGLTTTDAPEQRRATTNYLPKLRGPILISLIGPQIPVGHLIKTIFNI
jgi:hypothetical protein